MSRYLNGEGVKRNLATAIAWVRRAAVQGHAAAQFSLGDMYLEGWGVMQDYAEARRMYEQAAEQGFGVYQGS